MMKVAPGDSTIDISRHHNRNENLKAFSPETPFSRPGKFRSPDSTGNPEDDYSNFQSYIAEELIEPNLENQQKNDKRLIRISRPFRMHWDLLMIAIGMYSCVTTPFYVAFFDQKPDWFLITNIFLNLFYAVDILFNFFTTFIDSSGDEEFSKKRIVIHYLKNAFIFDLVSAIPIGELYELTNEKITQGEGLIILINLFKVNRVVRIGRLLRFTRTKDNVKVLMRLGMIILYILLWVHLTSCLWFYIIKQKEEWVPTTDYLTGKSELFTNSTLAKKYFTVLYHGVWLLVGNDVVPRDAEQAFAASILIITGGVITAVLFGEMVVLMSNLSRKQDQFQELLDGAMTTMNNMKLPNRLRNRILDYIAETHTSSSSQEEYETFKKYISPSLQQEVSACIYDPIISKNYILQNEERLAYMLVHRLQNRFTKPEDEIITEGAESESMFFLVTGEAQVFVTDKNMKKNSVCYLSPGSHFGELGLIYNIHRTASVVGYGYCTVAELSKRDFEGLVSAFPNLVSKMRKSNEIYDDPWKRYLLDALSQGHYFDALPRHSLNELAYIMDVIKLEKGSYLFKPGDQAKCIYLIAHGNLEISMTINEKHLHLLKAHENLPDIEPAPRIPKKHTTLDDYEAYNFDIFKAESLKKRADIVPIQNQKGIVGAIKLDEELPEQTSFIGDYPQEIILGNIGQGSLISSRKVFMKENYQFQCKAQTNATVYVLKLETLEDLAKHNTEFDYEINKIKAENEGKKFGDFLDVIQQDEGDSIRIQKLWASAIIRVILGLRQERRGGSALLLQITSKLKAIIACEEANNFDLAEKVIRGDIPPHYIQEDGTLDPAAINASLDSTLPRSHPIMIAFRDILDSITQPGGNIVRQYNALEKTILQQSKQIQTYDNYLNDLKTTLTKVIDKLKGKDYEAPITDRNKEIIKLDIQKVYLAQEARQKRRDERKAKKVQKKNDRGSSNEAVIRPKESEGSKDLLSFIKESKD